MAKRANSYAHRRISHRNGVKFKPPPQQRVAVDFFFGAEPTVRLSAYSQASAAVQLGGFVPVDQRLDSRAKAALVLLCVVLRAWKLACRANIPIIPL